MAADPNDVEKTPMLEFERKKQGALDSEKNREVTRDRINRLSNAGAFKRWLGTHTALLDLLDFVFWDVLSLGGENGIDNRIERWLGTQRFCWTCQIC